MAHDKKGPRFEKEVLKTLEGMEIECYGSHDQIPLRNLYPKSSPGEHFEIDIVCLIKGVCVLIETTTEKGRPSRKIKRFIRHCELIRNCNLDKREVFSHFKIPQDKLPGFTGINTWRYLYIGTDNELSTQNISPSNYPETDLLHIFDGANWEYFKMLERAINSTSRYEFFAALEIGPNDLSDPVLGSDLPARPYLEVTNITLGSGQAQASLYVAIFTPDELLRISRVSRFQGQPLTVSTVSSKSTENSTNKKSGGYQRILSHEKLEKIANFVNDNSNITFPTNLTIVLSKDCNIHEEKLHIPARYASIDIIDGQHRLFSYTLSNQERVRKEAKLIATAIKFHTEDSEEINRYAAQTFFTINREQTKVKRELMLLISYDVLDEKTPEAIAAKVLKVCDDKSNGVLERIFAIKAFIKKNQFDQRPIPIISVVEELARISKLENLKAINSILGNQTEGIEDSETLIQATATLLEYYFSLVKDIFPGDWGNPNSLLMCAKYIGAFIRLLGTFTAEEEYTIEKMREELDKIRGNIVLPPEI
jgi:DGQHR domain-containing protein